MQIKLGEKIKELRHRDGRKQENLANALGVTNQAVSRWESGGSYPDIELIPAIANYFHVSVDELFGIEKDNREKELESIAGKAEEQFAGGYTGEAITVLREGLAQYPNSYKLMQLLSEYLYCASHRCVDEKRKTVYREEGTLLAEKVVDECKDIDVKSYAVSCLCSYYKDAGRKEKAIELANCLPALSKYDVLKDLYTGTEKVKFFKEHVIDKTSGALLEMIILAESETDEGKAAFSEDERLIIYKKINSIYGILFDKEDYNFFSQFVQSAYLSQAEIYADRLDEENTVECLREYVRYGKEFSSYDENAQQISLPFNGVAYGGWVKSSPNGKTDYLNSIKNTLSDKRFDFVRERKDFPTV